MNVDKIINTTEKTDLEIIGATLLSSEEAIDLPKDLIVYDNYWWLRSPGNYQDYAAYVYYGGSVYYFGTYVNYDNLVVRPALQILLNGNWKIGDSFIFRKKEFVIINNTLAFCKNDIGYSRFDDKTNDYEKSEIKEYVDNWFKGLL